MQVPAEELRRHRAKEYGRKVQRDGSIFCDFAVGNAINRQLLLVLTIRQNCNIESQLRENICEHHSDLGDCRNLISAFNFPCAVMGLGMLHLWRIRLLAEDDPLH